MSRLIYENVAIGMILQRIAECRLVNFMPNMQALITQQTPREDKYRDMPIAVGDKIVVIEFKAPDTNGSYTVDDKTIKRLDSISKRLGDNVFVGFIHARLLPTIKVNPVGSPNGFYKLHAVPSTTIFVRAKELIDSVDNKNSNILDVETIHPELEAYQADSVFPECIYPQMYLPLYPICRTCGGIYCPFDDKYCICKFGSGYFICKFVCEQYIKLRYNKNKEIFNYLSLAQLLASLQSCIKGYRIKDIEELNYLIETLLEYQNQKESACSLLLIYSLERGIVPILL